MKRVYVIKCESYRYTARNFWVVQAFTDEKVAIHQLNRLYEWANENKTINGDNEGLDNPLDSKCENNCIGSLDYSIEEVELNEGSDWSDAE